MPTTPGSRRAARTQPPTTTPPQAPRRSPAPAGAVVNVSQLLTADQVAAQLQVQPRTVRGWINDGILPGYRVGRGYRVHPKHLAEFLAGSRVAGVS